MGAAIRSWCVDGARHEKESELVETDSKLVERCLKGDARSWEALLNTYSGRIFNMAYRYTGRFDLSEELTQDVFVKIYENLRAFRPETGSLQNWMMRVGRNLIIDNYRATRKEKNVAGSEELEVLDFKVESAGGSSPFEDLYSKERAEYLMSGLMELTPELREAVILRDIEGMAYQDIADLLGIPDGTVKSRINRGRIELAKVLRRKKAEEN